LEWILGVFFTLLRGRQQGFSGPCPIALHDIEAIYRLYTISEFMAPDEFVDYMLFLDGVAMEDYRKKQPKD
jgi:hypothetical protein